MKYLGLFIALIFYLGCDKIELPIRTPEAPIFEVNAVLGTQPVALIAGKDNVVVDTRFQNEELSVLQLMGELRRKDCVPPCPSSLRIVLRQNNREFLANPARSVKTGRRPFYLAPSDTFIVHANNASIYSNSGSAGKFTYIWTVNNNNKITDENISFNLNPRLRSNVCMMLTHPDGGTANQCQAIDYNLTDSFPGLKVNIRAQPNSNKTWSLVHEISGVPPFKILWDNKSLEQSIELDAKKPSSHCIKVEDSFGNMASACTDFNPEGKIKTQANFDLVHNSNRLKDFTQFNTVEVIYVDDKGIRYSSSSQGQPANSFFEILEETPYEDNDLKQGTKKLKLNFDLQLYGANQPKMTFKGGGSIAVAYPK